MLYVVHTDEQVVVRSTVQSVQYMYHLRRCIVRSIHEMDVVHTYIQVQQVLCQHRQRNQMATVQTVMSNGAPQQRHLHLCNIYYGTSYFNQKEKIQRKTSILQISNASSHVSPLNIRYIHTIAYIHV